jgi:hypothetical protein
MIVILDLVGPGWLLVIEALLERASVGVLKEEGSMELRKGKKWRCRPYPHPVQCKQAQRVSYYYHHRRRRGRWLWVFFLLEGFMGYEEGTERLPTLRT